MPVYETPNVKRLAPLVLDLLGSGAIENESGRASTVLAETLGEERLHVTQTLEWLEANGKLVREVRGRRTFVIRLPRDDETPDSIRQAMLNRIDELAERIESNRAERSSHEMSHDERRARHPSTNGVVVPITPDIAPPLPPEPEPIDIEAVAAALLRKVIDMTLAPQRADQAHAAVERDFAAVRLRLGEAVEEATRLRKRLRAVEDELGAYKHENDGLRQRCQHAEANLKRTLQSPPLDVQREKELRELVRTMQTKPGAYAGNRDRDHG